MAKTEKGHGNGANVLLSEHIAEWDRMFLEMQDFDFTQNFA